MKHVIFTLSFLAFAAGCATGQAAREPFSGPNIAGEWKGTLVTATERQTVAWSLTQDGSKVSGSGDTFVEESSYSQTRGTKISSILIWGALRGRAVQLNISAPNAWQNVPPTTAAVTLSEDGRTLGGTGQSHYIGPFRIELTRQ